MSEPLKRGQVLRETYRVEGRLSGSKIAYKARHRQLKTLVVVEQVADLSGLEQMELADRQRARQSFAHLRGKLKQFAELAPSAMARILDQVELNGRHFLVREWVEGLPLEHYVSQSLKPLEQSATLEFADQLLELLELLSREQPALVLGTLCPDYVIVTPQGKLRVADFGLALQVEGRADYELFGCPELLGDGTLDLRADLYSLGALLYFCLTGSGLPPIWERVTMKNSIPSPLELGAKVSGSVWSTLERMLSLSLDSRPRNIAEVRAGLAAEEFEETRESSPGTWYPEQAGLVLADSYPFSPMQRQDWILKIVQAATVGRARLLAVTQTREACIVDLRMAATDVPTPRSVTAALTSDAPIPNPTVLELAGALRTVGELSDFSLVLDDWRQAWKLNCRGGIMDTTATPSSGRAGITVTVYYDGRSVERARQAADEAIRLNRKTRLCPVPITLGKKPLEPGRGIEISELSKEVTELYLASVSFPQQGRVRLVAEPEGEPDTFTALTVFQPQEGLERFCHVDVRCFVAPGDGPIQDLLHAGYHFLRRPSRVLWYRHGVLCGEQILEKRWPLQLDIHLNGDHLVADNSGLKIQLPDWLQVSRLKPLLELSRILGVTKMKLKEHWLENPGQAAPKTQALAGMMGAPLFLFFLANLVSPGFLFLKSATVTALAKTSVLLGGSTGYLTATDHVEAVRGVCLKAIDLFEKEGV